MKVSLEWLSQFVEGPLEPGAAADALLAGGLPVEAIHSVGADAVLDVEVTSNRGDCLSILGVARELAALLDRPFRPLAFGAPETSTSASSVTSVQIDDLDLCPHYTARVLRDVRIGPSPAWMVRRLEAVGCRAINNVVDVTNYVMFEMGQPLHAFDFDKLEGRRIVVRQAREGEKIVSIDGHERPLSPPMLAICDAARPVALAGVMGGLESEVGPHTTNVLLESARFDPLSIRRTARALTMMSESSYRFERRIEPTLPDRASLRAAQLILETAGGELLAGLAQAGGAGDAPRTLSLRLAKLRDVLGIDIAPDQAVGALRRLQFSPSLKGDRIEVWVPSWRLDVNIEADLVEEVARVLGYDRIPVREEISLKLASPEPATRTVEMIRSTLIGAGYFEAVTFSFVSDSLAGDFAPPQATALARVEPRTRKADAQLRPSLVPGLLEAVRHNQSVGTAGARFFEIGSTFWHDSQGGIDERRRLALVGREDLHEVRGIVESLLTRLNADLPIRIVPADSKGFAAGAAGHIQWGDQTVGHLGVIDPAVAAKLSLRTQPAAAQLELAPLLANAQHVPQVRPLSRFPAVRRDVSLVLAEAVRYEQIESLIGSLSLGDLESADYVTTYRGKPLDKQTKSVTVTLVFRSASTTLTGEQVEGSVQRFIDAARQNLGATLRT
jgi:phenylalanyl-tRNA synthetase beta chain